MYVKAKGELSWYNIWGEPKGFHMKNTDLKEKNMTRKNKSCTMISSSNPPCAETDFKSSQIKIKHWSPEKVLTIGELR